MFNASKKSLGKFLCAVLSLVLLVSTVIMPVGAAQTCTKGHTDANSDYICDICGIFTGKVTGLKTVYEKSSSVKVQWNKVPGADGYKVYVISNPDAEPDSLEGLFDNIEIADTQATSLVISPLLSSISETIAVCAYKKIGSNTALGEESAPLTFHTVPAKVGGLKKSNILATSVTLSWKNNEINEKVRYNIFQYDSAKKTWKKIKTTKYTEYTVKGLKKNKTYKFRVEAFYKDGKKTYTGNVSKTLTVKTGDTQLNLKSTKLAVGTKQTLYVDGTSKKVTWSTSNKKVATVSSKGVIKGVKAGKATITAKVGKKSYTCKVEVKTPSAYLDWYFRKHKSIETTSSDGMKTYSIAFEDGKYKLSHLNAATSFCLVSFKKGSKNAKVELNYLSFDEKTFDIAVFDASANFTIAKYSSKNQPSFKFKDREGLSKKEAKKISNDIMNESFAAWNKLLKKNTGLTMKDLGFTAYKTK